MVNPSVNLQDSFLNQVRKDNTHVEVVLLTGASFEGVVRGFDNFTVVFHVEGKQHLVYKHAIAQLVAPRPPRSSQSDARPSRSDRHGSGKGRNTDRSQDRAPEKFNAIDLSLVKKEMDRASKDKPQSERKSPGNNKADRPKLPADKADAADLQESAEPPQAAGADTPETETPESAGAVQENSTD